MTKGIKPTTTVGQTVVHDRIALRCSWANITAATWSESRLFVEVTSPGFNYSGENKTPGGPIQKVLENDFVVVAGTGTTRDFIRLLTVELH